MKKFQKVANAVHRISNVFSWIAAIALFVMMALTFFDVGGRYIFNAPIIGAQDVIEQMMVVVVFCVLGQVTIDRIHIRADVLNPVLTLRHYCIISAIGFFIAAVTVAFMAWQTTIEAWKTVMNLNITTAVIRLPIAPFYSIAALGLILLFIEMVFDIAKYILEAKTASWPREAIEK